MFWGMNREQWPDGQRPRVATEVTFYCVSSNCTGTATLHTSAGAHKPGSPIALTYQRSDGEQTWAMEESGKWVSANVHETARTGQGLIKFQTAQRELGCEESTSHTSSSLSSPALLHKGLTVPPSARATQVLFLWESLSPPRSLTAACIGKWRSLKTAVSCRQ